MKPVWTIHITKKNKLWIMRGLVRWGRMTCLLSEAIELTDRLNRTHAISYGHAPGVVTGPICNESVIERFSDAPKSEMWSRVPHEITFESPGGYRCSCGLAGMTYEAANRHARAMACSPSMTDAQWVAMTGAHPSEAIGELLARLGDSATAWAAEFRKTAIQLGYSDMDEAWLVGWFANAIEHSTDVRRERAARQPPTQVKP